MAIELVGVDVSAKSGDSTSNHSRDIPAAQFVMDNDGRTNDEKTTVDPIVIWQKVIKVYEKNIKSLQVSTPLKLAAYIMLSRIKTVD